MTNEALAALAALSLLMQATPPWRPIILPVDYKDLKWEPTSPGLLDSTTIQAVGYLGRYIIPT